MTADRDGRIEGSDSVTGARAVVDALAREGIDHAFGIPGLHNLALLDELGLAPSIRFILTRHEQGSAFMAYGFARASGRPAVVTATEGPGVTNLATGIGAAHVANVPVISVCGAQESAKRQRDGTQDIDQITFMAPITKWAHSIPDAGKAQELVRKAFRVALSEPRGPVHIEAATDVLLEQTRTEPVEPVAYRNDRLPVCDGELLDRAFDLLAAAERPVLIAGRGVLDESVMPAMIELADRCRAPVVTQPFSPDSFPSTHPLALGPMGLSGWDSANETVAHADLFVAIGAQVDLSVDRPRHGGADSAVKVVHHSTAADHIGVVHPVAVAVIGSTASMLAGLIARAERRPLDKTWLDVADVRAKCDSERAAQVRPGARPVQPQYVAHTIREVLPRNGVWVVDSGNAGKHARHYFQSYQPGTFMTTEYWGAVGSALPIAMGVKLAQPERPVLCSAGDMGGLLNIAELETAVREDIPVVMVVLNDHGLGNERGFQEALYGNRRFGVDYRPIDLGAVARGLGAHGEQVTEPGELEGALRRALDSGKPAVVEVVIDPNSRAAVL